jgi:hypothetical protein
VRILGFVSLALIFGLQANLYAQNVPDSSVSPAENESRRIESSSEQLDRLELGSSIIKGNAELPKVLYIVPWQSAGADGLDGGPIYSLLDQVLKPLDRDVFLRHIDYFEQLSSSPVTDGATN